MVRQHGAPPFMTLLVCVALCARCLALCPAGKGIGVFGTLCDDCAAGKFQDQAGLTNCKDCTFGELQDQRGQTSCKDCTFGEFQDQEGQTSCKDCVAGKHQDETGQTDCKGAACFAGTFFEQVAQIAEVTCKLCVAGEFQDETAQRKCKSCFIPGQFQDEKAQTKCKNCVVGKFQDQQAQANCTNCAAGAFQDQVGASNCKYCIAGEFQDQKGQTSCKYCVAGEFQDQVAKTNCKGAACVAGTFFEQVAQIAAVTCEECVAGEFQDQVGKTNCKDCVAGEFQDQTAQANCESCTIGKFQDQQAQLACKDCYAGAFQDQTAQAGCESCITGKFQDQTAQTNCKSCITGKSQDQQASLKCKDCVAGAFQDQTAQANCKNCTTGKFQDQTAQTKCESCITGKFQDQVGETNCKNCVAGEFQDQAGETNCKYCVAGKFQDQTGKAKCKGAACAVGKFSEQVAQTAAVACTGCAVGKFQDQAGEPKCKDCVVGKFQDQTGETNCKDCVAGQFQDQSAQTNCKGAACVAGKFFEQAAQTSDVTCKDCRIGRYQDQTAAQACNVCGSGTFGSFRGQSRCMQCSVAAWCLSNNTCENTRTTTLRGCIDCKLGYAMAGKSCIRCPDSIVEAAVLTGLLVGFVLAILIAIARRLQTATNLHAQVLLEQKRQGAVPQNSEQIDAAQFHEKHRKRRLAQRMIDQIALVMTIMTFVQMSTRITSMHFDWPIEIAWFNDILAVLANFDVIAVARPECLSTKVITYAERWQYKLYFVLSPTVILALLLVSFFVSAKSIATAASCISSGIVSCAMVYKRCCMTNLRRKQRMTNNREKFDKGAKRCLQRCYRWRTSTTMHIASPMVGVYLMTFSLVAAMSAEAFDCKYDQVYKREVMVVDPFVECGSVLACKGEYCNYVLPGLAVICACGGVIIGICVFLYRSRATLMTDRATLMTFGSLYLRYRPETYYWEVCVLLRKFLLVVISRFLGQTPWTQIIASGALMCISLLAQRIWRPFATPDLNALEEVVLLACFAVAGVAALVNSQSAPDPVITVIYFLTMGWAFAKIAKISSRVWAHEGIDCIGTLRTTFRCRMHKKTVTRPLHTSHEFNGYTLHDPSKSLPDEVLLCLSRGALTIYGLDENGGLAPLKAWVASDIKEICAEGNTDHLDVIAVNLKSHSKSFSFEVECGYFVVEAWNRLNPKSTGLDGDRSQPKTDAQLLEQVDKVANAGGPPKESDTLEEVGDESNESPKTVVESSAKRHTAGAATNAGAGATGNVLPASWANARIMI